MVGSWAGKKVAYSENPMVADWVDTRVASSDIYLAEYLEKSKAVHLVYLMAFSMDSWMAVRLDEKRVAWKVYKTVDEWEHVRVDWTATCLAAWMASQLVESTVALMVVSMNVK